MDLDWKGPYRVVARDDEDLDRCTVQNLVTKRLEDFPTARMKLFVVNEREDPLLVANADKHLQIVEKILSHDGRKGEPHNLTFAVQSLGNPTTDTL